MTRDEFIETLSKLWEEHQGELSTALAETRLKKSQPHWLWDVYLMSICTNGGSNNYARKKEQYGIALEWKHLAKISKQNRADLFHNLPNPRRRKLLSPALEDSFNSILEAGGPESVALHYDGLATVAERMKFWKSFRGIGEKYARNIPMDIGDPLFTQHIALDSRINQLIDKVVDAPAKSNYEARETFVLALGQDAGITNAWYLDRLLYKCHDRF